MESSEFAELESNGVVQAAKEHYEKYDNVTVSENPHPLYGDYEDEEDSMKFQLQKHIDCITDNPDMDILVIFEFQRTIVYLSSQQAFKDFKSLLPKKIDRSDTEKLTFGKVYPDSLEMCPTSSSFKQRYNLFFRNTPFKKPESQVGLMLLVLEQYISKIKKNKAFDLVETIGSCLYDIVLTILFGEEFHKNIGKINYKYSDGRKYKTKFEEGLAQVSLDCIENGSDITSGLCPHINLKSEVDPYKRDQENIDEIYRVLTEFLTKNDTQSEFSCPLMGDILDPDSIKDYDPSELKNDLFLLIDAASGTLMLTIPSVLLTLKRNPEIWDKLYQELEKNGVIEEASKKNAFETDEGVKTILECEYLTYVIKEVMRLYPPTVGSSPYVANEEVTVCGVDISKDTQIFLNIASQHYNPKIWHNPLEFIPERFDPESELYYIPGTEDPRPVTSFIPFSFGKRKCAGDNYAMTALKVFVAYILIRVEFKIESKILSNQDYILGLDAESSLKVTITKKYG
ncbi:unnamed protein product [Moneuplotes crassus]|uniref:Cytochrome P450 n=1 Tax=Euplotes crassus TaxID=5936 RepID=A0AAD1UE48_EUPCR|nr:unnamed protein product [Moneuplotes crassus]